MNTRIKRTEEEIKAFLKKLYAQKGRVFRIGAAIEAIEKKFTEGNCYDKTSDDPEWEAEWDEEHLFYALDAVAWLEGKNDGSSLVDESEETLYDVEEVAEKINIPVEDWKGNCYGIACACVEHGVVQGIARYGQFLGNIALTGLFGGRMFNQHGWVELKDGTIFDPTRWAFEDVEPYIFVGRNTGDYDLGANKLRSMLGLQTEKAPSYDKKDTQIKLTTSNSTLNLIKEMLEDKREGNEFSTNQIFWLANIDPFKVGKAKTKRVFTALLDSDCISFVPIDNRKLIMEE